MYVVEIPCKGDDLAEPMGQMRVWLDNERVEPSVFRLSLVAGGTIFRLEFKTVREAEMVARAFGGELIADETSGAVGA
jgi:hypothetical protein